MQIYPWYTLAEKDALILQGEIIPSCPIPIPSTISSVGEKEISARTKKFDVIVLSQSCDLVQKKLNTVLVSPVWPFPELCKRNKNFTAEGVQKDLHRGNLTSYHLLNRCTIEGYETELLVVEFRSVYSIPLNSLEEFVKTLPQRLQLLPPYREHLSQAFARFFMRVGLPADIPPF